MFSAGDDKLVKCWDLEQNKVGYALSTVASSDYMTSIVFCCNVSPYVFRSFVLITVISVVFIAWLFILPSTFCLREVEILCVGYVLYSTLIWYLFSMFVIYSTSVLNLALRHF